MLDLEREPEDVLLGEQRAKIARVFRLLVDFGGAWGDPFLCNLADRVAEIEVFLRDRIELGECGHGCVRSYVMRFGWERSVR